MTKKVGLIFLLTGSSLLQTMDINNSVINRPDCGSKQIGTSQNDYLQIVYDPETLKYLKQNELAYYAREAKKIEKESIFIRGGRRMVLTESAILGAYGGWKLGEYTGNITEQSMRSALYSLIDQLGIQRPRGSITMYDFIAGFAGVGITSTLSPCAGMVGLATPFIVQENLNHFAEKQNPHKEVIQKSAQKQALEAFGWGTAGMGLCTSAAVIVGGAPIEKSTLVCAALYALCVASSGLEDNYKN